MIPRNRPGAPKADPEVAPVDVEYVEVRQLDFSFGPGDSYNYELYPEDKFDFVLGKFVLTFADGEKVTIDGTRVRLWSDKTSKVRRTLKPFVPADPALSV